MHLMLIMIVDPYFRYSDVSSMVNDVTGRTCTLCRSNCIKKGCHI